MFRTSWSIPAYRWMWLHSLFGTMGVISLVIARGWLVLELTDSPFWVGFTGGLRGITQIALGTFSGVLLDRINRRHALLVVDIGNALLAFGMGILILSGKVELWHILLATAIEGMFMSVRWPAINTMVYQIAGSERILNASAAQMLGFNLGKIVASAIAGVLIATYGVGNGYLFAVGCILLSVASVWIVQGEFRSNTEGEPSEPFRQALQGGLNYIWNSHSLRWLITFGLMMALLGWSYLAMLPVVARDVLGLDASGLGFLNAAGGIGALVTTSLIASLGNYQNKIRLLLSNAIIVTIGLILFALSTSYPLSLILQAILNGALMGFETTLTATVLLVTNAKMQGRVQGVYSLLLGFAWLGGIVLGGIATISSAPLAIGLAGIAIGLTIAVLWRPVQQIELAESSE